MSLARVYEADGASGLRFSLYESVREFVTSIAEPAVLVGAAERHAKYFASWSFFASNATRRKGGEAVRPARTARGRVLVRVGDAIELGNGRGGTVRLVVERVAR